MDKFAIQYSPTGDLLDMEGYLAAPDWIDKDVLTFDSEAEAESYLYDQLFGTDGQGLDHEVISYHDTLH
ncbi:hypothetical protein BEP19_15250 [Ammoniphilus oxalaticus]|uniref:Uncharacterized protein n=1 Tax=Ammoniphilus oxalaticus TaxID=66863 RepID=A0A419SD62_9BACL|nr:hypothetical protein [Ammoniphilus oxalaticus]RKD21035.1 hypothetical protein BEP19_15250 [Ammoniphilus oxalaticus]